MDAHRRWTALLASGLTSLLAAGVVASAAPTTAAPADHPSQVSYRDVRGDVWRLIPQTEEKVRLHHYPRADETHAVFRHGAHAVTARVRFVDLQPVGTHLFWMHLRTRDYQWDAVVTSKPGHRKGQLYFQGDDGSKSCAGFTRSIDYAGDLVTLRIPNSCLHDARWVRTGIFNDLTYHHKRAEYHDNPMNDRVWGHQTPRLYAPQS